MKTGMCFALRRLIAVAAVLVCAGEVSAAGLTCTGVPGSGDVTSKPISCTVICRSGGTIASAVALAPRTTNRLAVTIQGTCFEAISDHGYDRITLQGGPAGGAIRAPSASTESVVSLFGRRIFLTNLTISGGIVGLQANHGAQFNGTNVVIEGASSADLLMNGAAATLTGATIRNSGIDGIDENQGAVLLFDGGTIRGNARYGADILGASSVEVYGNAVVENNGIAGASASDGGSILVTAGVVGRNGGRTSGVGGLSAGAGGHVRVESSSVSVVDNFVHGIGIYGGTAFVDDGATIANNEADGIHVQDGGVTIVQGGSVISGNSGNGIFSESGNVHVGDFGGPATIENNGNNGVLLRTNSVAKFNNASNQIIDNHGWGILCTEAPSNPLIYGALGTVSGNSVGQVSCNTAPSQPPRHAGGTRPTVGGSPIHQ